MPKGKIGVILFAASAFLIFVCGGPFAESAPIDSFAYSSEPSGNNEIFPAFTLPVPKSDAERAYLGLSGTGPFDIRQIKAQVLIIEAFGAFCSHCHHAAPYVNEVYEAIEGRLDLKDQVKIIGVGMRSTPFEVDLFKEKLRVPFPLFADKDMVIEKLLSIDATPTFIGVKINRDGSKERFYFRRGPFENALQFLSEIIRLSGIAQEAK
jgi:thiol-disulfide isomerase/thioredoxin